MKDLTRVKIVSRDAGSSGGGILIKTNDKPVMQDLSARDKESQHKVVLRPRGPPEAASHLQ